MIIEYDDDLRQYLLDKGLSAIAVEVVSSQHSDIEVTELYVHTVKPGQAEYMKAKKKFRGIPAPIGELLLPAYRLEYDETVSFRLKKTWIFRSIAYTGIRL